MKRLVFSLFAVAFTVGFNACEQHAVADLPPHYLHKADKDHGSQGAHGKDEKHADAHAPAKDPNAAKDAHAPAPAAEKKH